MCNSIHLLPLDRVNNILRLFNHPVVLIVHLLHAHDVVIPRLFCEEQTLLHLLLRPVFEEEEVFLQCLDLVLHLPDRFFVRAEVELYVVRLPKCLVYNILLNSSHLIVEVILGVFESLLLQSQFVIERLNEVNLVSKSVLDLQGLLILNVNFILENRVVLYLLVICLLQELQSGEHFAVEVEFQVLNLLVKYVCEVVLQVSIVEQLGQISPQF